MLSRLVPAVVLVLALVLTGCGGVASEPSAAALPTPTCGGMKIRIEGALPCDEVVRIAVDALMQQAPEQIARGVESIDVFLTNCPRNEVPPQVDCGAEEFAQMVTVTFRDAPAGGGFAEPSLTVAVAPVSGRVLGIVNPLIR
jgi:hypothetical protein